MNNFDPLRVQFLALLIAIFFLFFVIKLIINGKLREEFSFFFIVLASGILIATIMREKFNAIGSYLGVYEPINLIFAGLIILCFFYLLFLSVVFSDQKEKIKKITQEMAILKNKIELNKKQK
jgi:hypothetical protein